MVLAVHAIVSAAIGAVSPGVTASFASGLFSHFILDALPHWEYQLISKKLSGSDGQPGDFITGRLFVIDLFKIGLDLTVGLMAAGALILYFYPEGLGSAFWGAAGGVFPDFLQFVFCQYRWRMLQPLQKFHRWIHTRHKLSARSPAGLLIQAALIFAAAAIIIWLGQ